MSAFDIVIQLIYVLAASCFVFGLHLMNTPATARRGNQLSTGGMAAAIVATLAIIIHAGTITVTGWIVMLAGALLGLIEERPFDQLTIQEITGRAGIAYATFFRHYPDKQALLDDVASEQIRGLMQLVLPLLDSVDARASAAASRPSS